MSGVRVPWLLRRARLALAELIQAVVCEDEAGTLDALRARVNVPLAMLLHA